MYQGTLDPISNRADWFGTLQLVNDDTGEIITDLTGVTIVIQIGKDCYHPILSATLDNGKVTDLGGGVLQWHFAASEMRGVCPETYEIGITMTRDDVTEQEFIGYLPILDGVVRQ
jgi:hypothetical protein